MELAELVSHSETGLRMADKLFKVHTHEGDALLLHGEIQSQKSKEFARRMYVYNYRASDRYNEEVVSFVLLGDNNPEWQPSQFLFERWGCRKEFSYETFKLIRRAGHEEQMLTHDNPFALMVIAHLQALVTSEQSSNRMEWKRRVLEELGRRQKDLADARHWYRYLNWLLPLVEPLEQQLLQELRQKENVMSFIPYVERIAMQQGVEPGLEQGLKEGLEQGLEQGLEIGLQARFGDEGLALLPEIRSRKSPDFLRKLLATLWSVQSLDEFREYLASFPNTGDQNNGQEDRPST